jgi:hypothetical protein
MVQATSGYPGAMEVDVLVQSVEEVETRSGKIRYVVRDADGKEYTTFRPAIGREAGKFEGGRAHIVLPRGRAQRVSERLSGRDRRDQRAVTSLVRQHRSGRGRV